MNEGLPVGSPSAYAVTRVTLMGFRVHELELDLRQQRLHRARAFVVLAVVAAVLSIALSLFAVPRPSAAAGASPDQERIVRRLGAPSYFTLAYLPLGPKRTSEIVRTEIWYYPEHGQSIYFVDGEVVSVDPADNVAVPESPPRLVPWRIDDRTPRSQIDSGSPAARAPVALAPDTARDSDVYLSKDALYVVEHGRLIYLSTAERSGLQ